jgi:hypothetical protein
MVKTRRSRGKSLDGSSPATNAEKAPTRRKTRSTGGTESAASIERPTPAVEEPTTPTPTSQRRVKKTTTPQKAGKKPAAKGVTDSEFPVNLGKTVPQEQPPQDSPSKKARKTKQKGIKVGNGGEGGISAQDTKDSRSGENDNEMDGLAAVAHPKEELTPLLGNVADPNEDTDRRSDHKGAESTNLERYDATVTQGVAKEDSGATAEAVVSSKSPRKKKEKKRRNELTSIIPGYTAPMKLSTSWSLAGQSSSSVGLEALRRQAVREDPSTRRIASNARLMVERSTTGNITSSYKESHAPFMKKRKSAPTADAGQGWFGMRPTAMTEEIQRDLALIRNRNYLDPKRFYKSADNQKSKNALVQAGTVVEGPTEFFSSRLTKKERKATLVGEILADKETARYAQGKYLRMQQEKTAKSQQWGKKIKNRQEYRKKPV